jgi:hypothetical protein
MSIQKAEKVISSQKGIIIVVQGNAVSLMIRLIDYGLLLSELQWDMMGDGLIDYGLSMSYGMP